MKCPYPPHGSHTPSLMIACAAAKADSIIEFGAGNWSTRVLQTFSKLGAFCASVEDNPAWVPVETEMHRVYSYDRFWLEMDQVRKYANAYQKTLNSVVALVDNESHRRADAIKRLVPIATVIVVHDTEAEHEHIYGSRAAIRRNWKAWRHIQCPWTGIVTTVAWNEGSKIDEETLIRSVMKMTGEEAMKFQAGICDVLDMAGGVS